MEETGTERAGDTLDLPRIATYLRERLGDLGLDTRELSQEMAVTRFSGGHSNLTYLVRFGALELVMRRPPFGPLPPAAHDVAREYRWLSSLSRVFALVPKPYLLCEDVAVAGAVFYVMERRQGVVLRQDEPPAFMEEPSRRRRASEAFVDALAGLHAIDIETAGLSHLGKPRGFVARQVSGWTDRWHRAQTSPSSALDTVAAWLAGHVPLEPVTPSLVHGDFKLDNVMLDPDDLRRIVAILDWEMCALGDPLTDLGMLLTYWAPTAPPGEGDAAAPFTQRPGWLTREGIIERYAEQSKRDVTDIQFYEILAMFKVAVVIQQIFHRYVRGETHDARFARFDTRVAYLASRALARIE